MGGEISGSPICHDECIPTKMSCQTAGTWSEQVVVVVVVVVVVCLL